jgi:Protein of unknown function (DUF2931)
MKLQRLCSLMLLVALLPACASEQHPSDPYIKGQLCNHWSLGVAAPGYMEAWVEDLEVKDDRDRWVQIPMGVVGEFAQTVGWPPPNRVGGGGGSTPDSAGAPMEVSIRWQSLAEPQTYTWQFIVPENMRQAMAKKEPVVWAGHADTSCRNLLTLGVAPGGRTIVWINGFGFQPTEILRGQAEVEPLGPDQGQHEGRYVRFSDKAKQYVQEHGIPYGSWDH